MILETLGALLRYVFYFFKNKLLGKSVISLSKFLKDKDNEFDQMDSIASDTFIGFIFIIIIVLIIQIFN